MSGASAKVEKLDLMSVAEAAELLGKCEATIIHWIRRGKIKALRVGKLGDFMIPREDLMKSLEYKPVEAKQ